jgi:hypothetical protein
MGDCGSRLTPIQFETHETAYCRKHDHKFHRRPGLSYLKDIVEVNIVNAELAEQYENYCRRLQSDIRYLNSLKDVQPIRPISGHSGAYLALEVCKGMHFYPQVSCLQASRSVVRACVTADTWQHTHSQPNPIPTWNEYFELQTKSPFFESLKLAVSIERRFGKTMEYGTLVIPYEAVRDQEVISGWFDLENAPMHPEGKPKLFLRMQFITNLTVMLVSHQKICEDTLNQATKAYALCKRLLNQVAMKTQPPPNEIRGSVVKHLIMKRLGK